MDYLSDPGNRADFKTRKRALGYCLLDWQLYKKTPEEVLLKCLVSVIFLFVLLLVGGILLVFFSIYLSLWIMFLLYKARETMNGSAIGSKIR